MPVRFRRSDREAPPAAADNGGAVATSERDQAYADERTAPPPAADGERTSGATATPPAAGERDQAYADNRTADQARVEDDRTSVMPGRGNGTATTGRTATRARAAEDAVVLDREARMRQRDEFGGINWGAAFFGWIVAIGLGVLLTAIVSAAGAAIGLTDANTAKSHAATIGIVGGALLIAIAVISYYAGGYVAGRMSRFDGARQGFGVWLLGLVITLLVAGAGAILGDQYNVFEQLNLPRIPVSTTDLTTGGAITLAAIVLGSLLAAVLGGKVGQRYHRRVDRAAYVD